MTPLHNRLDDDRTPSRLPPSGNADYLNAFGLLGLAWIAFAWPWLSGRLTIPWDAKAHFAPQVQFLAQSIAAGEWPFWNPYAFSGQVQVADPQGMVFSPPMLLLALANPSPSLWAIDATTLAMLLVAGAGVLCLARDQGWHWAAGLVAALAFAFGAAMAWRLQHFGQVFTLAYFPFALLLLDRALARHSLPYGAMAGLVAAFIVLGRDQIGLLCVYLLVLRVLWYWLDKPERLSRIIRSLLPLAAGALVGGGLIALPILMTLQLAEISNRPAIDYAGAAAGSLHPALLVTSVTPHVFGAAGEMAAYWGPPSFTWEGTGLFLAQNMGIVYIGAIPLTVLALGLARGDFLHPTIRYLSVAFLGVLLYALGGYTPAFRLFYEILPGVDFFRRPADAVFLIGGLAALLSGYAVHRMLSKPATPARATISAAMAIIALPFCFALAFALYFGRLPSAVVPLLTAVAVFAASAALITAALWLKPIRPHLAALLLTVPLAADLIWNNGPNGATGLPARSLAMLEPDSREPAIRELKTLVAQATTDTRRPRVELIGLGFHWPNASLPHRLENTLGYNPVRLQAYAAATGAGDTSGLAGPRPKTALFPGYNTLLANMLGLQYIVTGQPLQTLDPAAPPSAFKLVWKTRSAYIYENPRALPRVLFASRAKAVDFSKIVKTGQWPENFDPRTTVLLEPPTASETASASETGNATETGWASAPGTARIARYTNTEIQLEAESPNGGWIVLNDLWHPWWEAETAGRNVKILKANVLFRAIRVPAGRVRVNLTFRPIRGALQALIASSTETR